LERQAKPRRSDDATHITLVAGYRVAARTILGGSVTTRPVGISMVFSGITRLMLSLPVRRITA